VEPLHVGIIAMAALVVALLIGVPVAAALALCGLGGMYFAIGETFTVGQLRTLPFSVVSNYGFAVLPLFILMGSIASFSGVAAQLFRAADAWLRGLKGGMYYAVIYGSSMFSAVSGSTVANSVLFMRLAFPDMVKAGYSRSLSIGIICATGALDAMIPPSITMVIYAIVTEQSVGQLLIAGIIPGLLSAVIYAIGIYVMIRLKPALAPPVTRALPMREKLTAIAGVWPIMVLVVVIFGGIYAGVFAPTAAGAVGAAGALVLALVLARGNPRGWLWPSMTDAASISCIIFLILIGGLLFSRMILVTGVVDVVADRLVAFSASPLAFLGIVTIIYLILGMFIDTTSMMLITLPFMFPAAQKLGIDAIWFGIIIVKLVEIGVLTPPVGLNLFAVMSVVDKDTTWSHLIRGVVPFILLELIVLVLLVAYPELSLWLPRKMLEH
jgi:tripartite ATP-independent transporter DctM subunit